ncbi:hypothetical protein X471_00795 [Bartonella bacilliformis str. Heidi Mejia]|nr:hypothetical protein X471_00795 [Bartonella bacilliformis str. Heidi Mejia]KEG20159.1 hypothetical protein H707_00160 [Bartonella bacilliformis Hosp800-02]KEG24965.1 hypothetical protein H706_00161 [Bartonella bacilliformis CAR600-02]
MEVPCLWSYMHEGEGIHVRAVWGEVCLVVARMERVRKCKCMRWGQKPAYRVVMNIGAIG